MIKEYIAAVIVLFTVMFGFLLASDVGEAAIVNNNRSEQTFIVLSTEIRWTSSKGSDLYLINIQRVNGTDSNYSKGDIETVQVEDNWALGNTRSADLYFALKNSAGSNQVWIGDIGGIRNGWLSWFPHIINAELTAFTVE